LKDWACKRARDAHRKDRKVHLTKATPKQRLRGAKIGRGGLRVEKTVRRTGERKSNWRGDRGWGRKSTNSSQGKGSQYGDNLLHNWSCANVCEPQGLRCSQTKYKVASNWGVEKRI